MDQLEELYQRGNTFSRFLVFVRFERVEFLDSSDDGSDPLTRVDDTPVRTSRIRVLGAARPAPGASK